MHAEIAVESARAGKHILGKKTDRRLSLESDVIGAPALAQVTREANLGESFREHRQWFLDEERAAGGVMLSGGIHDIEKLRTVLDAEVQSVHARRPRQRIDDMDGNDTSVVTVRFDDGTVGVLVESFAMKSLETASGEEAHSLRVDGDRGSIVVERDGPIRVFSEDDVVPWADGSVDHRLAVPSEDTFVREVSHFLECVRTGSTPLTDGRSQRRALEIVLAAYESMETRDLITL